MLNQTGFGSGPVTIHGYEVYNFARTVGGDTSTTTPSSYNEFKKFAGFLGFVTDKVTGQPAGQRQGHDLRPEQQGSDYVVHR